MIANKQLATWYIKNFFLYKVKFSKCKRSRLGAFLASFLLPLSGGRSSYFTDHRMVEVGRDLKVILSNVPAQKQGHLELVAKGHTRWLLSLSNDGEI